ncbi:pyocin knob domain-containing protein [Pseudomonas oryzihabitans]|uniref:pyocin knob domain-containing protein n=1 Tax=Pseudomonas oryzihabitans TaxID=47885 RepID=UPI00073686AE|nr:pyocin knob domain-containing protein [Pseudomonas psychrotolerans]
MALQQVNFGSASDGSQGDTARAAFAKINQNFSDTTNAASRLVGLAAGNVLEVGAYNFGVTRMTVSGADLNSYQTSGMRALTLNTAANAPYAEYGYLLVDAVGDVADRVAQTWVSTTGRRFSRTLNSTGWTTKEYVFQGDTPSFATVGVNGAPGSITRQLAYRSNGSTRFEIGLNGDAESGSNSGSNLVVNRYNDAGAYQDQPLRIERSTGESRMTRLQVLGPVRVGQYTLASLPSASAFNSYEIDVTDAAGGAKRCRSDGTNWKIINTTTTVS